MIDRLAEPPPPDRTTVRTIATGPQFVRLYVDGVLVVSTVEIDINPSTRIEVEITNAD